MVTYRQVDRGMVRSLRAIHREAKRTERRRIAYQEGGPQTGNARGRRRCSRRIPRNDRGPYRCARDHLPAVRLAHHRHTPKTSAPERISFEEEAACAALARYTPGWFAKTFGLEKGQRAKLAAAIETARGRDEAALRTHQAEAENRNAEITFAQQLVGRDHGTITTALSRYSSLGQLPC
jgi:hypothetical protein